MGEVAPDPIVFLVIIVSFLNLGEIWELFCLISRYEESRVGVKEVFLVVVVITCEPMNRCWVVIELREGDFLNFCSCWASYLASWWIFFIFQRNPGNFY